MDMNPETQIGTAQLLRLRIFQDDNGEDVAVPPGTYPVYRVDNQVWIQYTGQPSRRREARFSRLGGDLFAIQPGGDEIDQDADPVSVRSVVWTAEQFVAFVESDEIVVGPDPRYRFNIEEGALHELRKG